MGLNHSQTLSEKHSKIMAALLSFSFALVPRCLGSTCSVSLGWQYPLPNVAMYTYASVWVTPEPLAAACLMHLRFFPSRRYIIHELRWWRQDCLEGGSSGTFQGFYRVCSPLHSTHCHCRHPWPPPSCRLRGPPASLPVMSSLRDRTGSRSVLIFIFRGLFSAPV